MLDLSLLTREERIELLGLMEERDRRIASRPTYHGDLFAKQRAFIDDPSPLKAALCTRRAGKSTGLGDGMLEVGCKWPGEIIPYIALTRGHAKRIMWTPLQRRARSQGLKFTTNLSELTFTIENGATIMFMGADDESEIEKIRGIRTPLAVVDECQSFRAHFKGMVEEVIEPALADLSGQLWLAGTPGPVCGGAFFEATALKDSPYSVHRWGWQDNPHIDIRAWLETRKRLRGWSEDTPAYKREWKGEWHADPDALVYRFLRENNLVSGAPKLSVHVCGMDFGSEDNTAFSVWGANFESGEMYALETFKRPKMNYDQIRDEWKRLNSKYDFARTVGDSGALGKMVVEELKRKYGLPIAAAEKQHKWDFIEHMNTDFVTGRIKLVESETKGYQEELVQLPKDLNKLPKRVEDERFPNDLCDASLYAYRAIMHYATERTKVDVQPRDIFARPDESELMRRRAEESLRRQRSEEWI